MARVDIQDGRIAVDCLLAEKELVEQVPGSSSSRGRWSVPLSWASCIVLRGVFGDRLEIGPALTEWATAWRDSVVAPATELRSATEVDHSAYPALAEVVKEAQEATGFNVWKHQAVNAAFGALVRQACYADEPGAGKTGSTALTLRLLHARGEQVFPALVVCPKSMKIKWKRDLEQWWPGIRVVVVSGTALQRRKILEGDWDVAVINQESVKAHSRLAPYGSTSLAKCEEHGGIDPAITEAKCEKHDRELNGISFRAVVVDEAHFLRNASKQTRGIWAVAHQDTVTTRLALTGTPVSQTPADAWGLMHFLAPVEHPGKVKYTDRFVEKTYDWAGYLVLGGLLEHRKAEFAAATDYRWRRVLKAEALPELPPVLYDPRPLELAEMPPKQRKAYEEMAKHQFALLESGLLTAVNPLSKMLRLTQFACACAQVDYDTTACKHGQPVHGPCTQCPGHVALPREIVTLTEPSNKLDAIEELIEELGPNEPLVVGSASRQLVELAEKRWAKEIPLSIIKGGQSEAIRQGEIDRYQRGGPNSSRVCLVVLAAGGVGIDLNRGHVGTYIQKSWDPILNLQFEGRYHRGGSEVHDSVETIDYFTEDTIEVVQREVLDGKAGRAEDFLRDKDALARLLQFEPKPEKKPRKKKPSDDAPDDPGTIVP